jgi:hypothetical protein
MLEKTSRDAFPSPLAVITLPLCSVGGASSEVSRSVYLPEVRKSRFAPAPGALAASAREPLAHATGPAERSRDTKQPKNAADVSVPASIAHCMTILDLFSGSYCAFESSRWHCLL